MKKKLSKTTILYAIVGLVIVGAGATLGLIKGQEYFSPKINYADLDATTDENDEELYNQYLNLVSKNATKEQLSEEFRPYQLTKIALMNFEKTPNAQITNRGEVLAMGVEQIVRAKYVKQDQAYFSESLSSGVVSVAWRFYQNENVIKTYEGKLQKGSNEQATWNQDATSTYSVEEFKESWGKSMPSPFIYILNRKTVVSESCTFTNDNYVISLSLHKILSVGNYAKQMLMTSNLRELPIFDSVNLKLTLSSDLRIVKNEITEEYQVNKFGPWISTKGSIVEEYEYLDDVNIPKLKENAIY